VRKKDNVATLARTEPRLCNGILPQRDVVASKRAEPTAASPQLIRRRKESGGATVALTFALARCSLSFRARPPKLKSGTQNVSVDIPLRLALDEPRLLSLWRASVVEHPQPQ